MKPNKFLELVSSPLMNLDHTYRYSGTKLVESESLSQHIVDTIMMGLKIINDINAIGNIKLNDAIYLRKAVYHDLEEVITGDVPRPLKYHDESTLSALRQVADDVAKDLFQAEFYNWHQHYLLWDTAKDGLEGFILKIVDNLVVSNKVVKEVSLLNNYYMLRVAYEVVQYTQCLKELILEDSLIDDVATNNYLLDLLEGSIVAMNDILEEHKDKLPLCSHSMI